MNLEEFAALEIGDKIDNPMSQSSGTVTERTQDGVRVRWGEGTPGRNVLFTYTVNSTAWMHWTYAPRDCTSGPCYREDCRRGDQCLGGDYNKIIKGE